MESNGEQFLYPKDENEAKSKEALNFDAFFVLFSLFDESSRVF